MLNTFSMSHLHKLVHRKKVSLVGPSPILLDKGLGKRIDSSDVVIRCGTTWPGCDKAEDAREDIGYRSDVAIITDLNPEGLKSISERFDLKLLIYFWSKPPQHWRILERYLRSMEIPFESGKAYKGLYAFTSILLMLSVHAKNIYVSGINFSQSKANMAVAQELIKDPRILYADHVFEDLSKPLSPLPLPLPDVPPS